MTPKARLDVIRRILDTVHADAYSFPGEERLFKLPHSEGRRYLDEKWYYIDDEGDFIIIARKNVDESTFILESDGNLEEDGGEESALDALLAEIEVVFNLYWKSMSKGEG